jgi:hypothetical protein
MRQESGGDIWHSDGYQTKKHVKTGYPFLPPAMDRKSFNDIYHVVELGSMVMDFLPLSALLSLSYASKEIYVKAHFYTHHKLTAIFAPFGISFVTIINYLRLTNALVIGPVALKAVAPAILPVFTTQLDIVVPINGLVHFNTWLTLQGNYQCESRSNHHVQFPSVKQRLSFVRHTQEHKYVVNLLVVGARANAYQTLFHSFSTVYMNAISGSSLFTAYRSLLNHGKAAHNYIPNTMAMENNFSSTTLQLSKDSVVSQLKTMHCGFSFTEPNHPFPRLPSQCRCTDRSACPLTLRNTNDKLCSMMQILTTSELDAIQTGSKAVPIDNPVLSTIIWRLGDVAEGGSPGYAFELNDGRARLIILDIFL